MQFNVNMNAVHAHATRLQKMGRAAFPVAVRRTLDSAAFNTKQTTMPAKAASTFEKRQPNFFKANSKVAKAQGLTIAGMQSTVGFISLSGNNRAIDDLQQQEHGGNIAGRAFIPLKEARTGNSWHRNVKRSNRISDISSKIVDSAKGNGKNDAEKFTRSAIHAGKGGWVIGTRRTSDGNRILFSIRSIVRKTGKNGSGKVYDSVRKSNTIIKSMPMYAVLKGRRVRPKATHFMEQASRQSANNMDRYFIEHAQKQIDKIK